MNKERQKRLEKAGWKFGTVAEFLNLTPEENELVEIRVALTVYFEFKRNEMNLTQDNLAKKLGSSQSRVSKIENCDPTVSLDLLLESLVRMGVSRKEIGRVIAGDAA
ncbi:MAG: helix-turn-helix transcriptional regulator [Phycisphaerales bacterium]|jgi:DNA-binding XRE family transcriptional regulator|nr:helix-turn-helix transcriptional regulator [Phycisphaerales bacterium]